jgi:hypothetical protein
LTPIRIPYASRFQSTPVSAVLTKHGLRLGHRHQFITAYGNEVGLFPPTCILWRGRNVDVNRSAVFLDNLIKYSDARTASKWIDFILDPDSDRTLINSTMGMVPPTGFADQNSFQAWRVENKQWLDQVERR